ncbi:hypothetical protein [Nakamurella multipartita]|uniref:Uncharacterized protein n=1 Tax=Nakamurella multipartita (strain ATCC 700099 / DSM 44233 / CIP 104796 / JCM 9543 / NBRC 105858 / Y-104) TaxID=479431 RepID=C8X8J3_NAKMY|nr:hypothetical protein [Nakamurella multipartita]ACV79048.1 hypothetical protein Namu_2702 [Nakamurella multipartita DSM 44233]
MGGRDRAGSRHSWLDTLTRSLSRIIAGQHAATLLATDLPADGAVVDLPDWLWSVPAIDTGRKAAGDGGALLLPIQVEHSPGPLLVIPRGAAVDVLWRALGLGIDRAGSLIVHCEHTPLDHDGRLTTGSGTTDGGDADGRGFDPDVTCLTARPTGRSRIRARLSALVRDGQHARWEVLRDLEPYVRSAVRTAHSNLTLELTDGAARLDDTELQTVTDRLILGHDGAPDSPVLRLLNRLITPGQVTNVDLLHHIRRTLRRDAADTLLQHIGDPRVGATVRRFARQTGITDPDRLLVEFRRAYPQSKLGPDRLLRSLSTPLRVADASGGAGRSDQRDHGSADICGNPIGAWGER